MKKRELIEQIEHLRADVAQLRVEVAAELRLPRMFPPPVFPAVGTGTGTFTRNDYAERCPCNPANGGSGVCGCVLGGPQVTCSTSP